METEFLTGRRALVVGGSRGLGREIALALARAGAAVALTYHQAREQALQVAEAIAARGRRALVRPLTLEEPAGFGALLAELAVALGGLDLLVVNAGATGDRLLLRLDEAEWDRLVEVNLSGPARLCRAALPLMGAGGAIVLIGSRAGLTGREGQAAYGAAKAGLTGLGRTLAREAAPAVTVNVVVPGYLPTDMGLAAPAEVVARARQESLTGELGDVTRTAEFVAWLAASGQVTGQVFRLDSRIY